LGAHSFLPGHTSYGGAEQAMQRLPTVPEDY
jgi:hypothetical protein